MDTKMMNPRISIIMATYNRAHLIKDSLLAVKAQSFVNWECLVVDDGSTDNTNDIVTALCEVDSRFKYFKRPENYKKGLPGCRNLGLDLMTGKYVVFFDDDDIAHPDLLLMVENAFSKKMDFVRYLRSVFTGKAPSEFDHSAVKSVRDWHSEKIFEMISGKIPFNSCQIVWRKECFEKARFDENLMFAEEWELYSRILTERRTGLTLEKVLYFARKHAASNTGEFSRGMRIRKSSMVEAAKQVMRTIKLKDLWDGRFYKFFLRMSFELKDGGMLEEVLAINENSFVERKFIMSSFRIYPLLRPVLLIKSKL